MTPTPVTGRCLCGAIQFEIGSGLGNASYCHCTRCQRRTGTAASVQARFDGDSLRFTSGEELLKAYDPGEGSFHKLFCAECGSSLFSRSPSDPSVWSVRFGALDTDPGVRPSYRQFVAYAATWEQVPDDGLPHFPERRPPDS
jgi:hypothetical protein